MANLNDYRINDDFVARVHGSVLAHGGFGRLVNAAMLRVRVLCRASGRSEAAVLARVQAIYAARYAK